MPTHLGTAWVAGKGTPKDGRFAGAAIKLDDHHILMHDRTHTDLSESALIHHDDGKSMISFPGKPEIHPHEPPARGDQRFGWNHVEQGLAGSQFGLYKRAPFVHYGHKTNGMEAANQRQAGDFKPPVFERNTSHLGSDCSVHGWREGATPSAPRQFVKFPVKPDCPPGRGGHCSLKPTGKDSGVCRNNGGDRGSPVTCGPEGKLTYLVTRGASKPCQGLPFEAFHVGHLVPELERNKVSTTG